MDKITFGALALLFCMLLASTASAPAGNWTIDGDRVYVNDSKAYISASPHTIHESQWVYFNISSKNYTGDVDIAFGFDTEKVKPKTAELYKPQTVLLPDTFSEKIFYYVTNITTTSLYPEYGNDYNTYRREIKHKLPIGFDNSTNSTIWGNFTSIVAFDSYSQSGQNYTINWSTRNYQNTTWTNVADRFDSISWDYDGFNKWYYSPNLPIVAGNYYNLRVWMEVPVSLTPTIGKYGFAIKPSSQTLEQAKTTGNLYYLDPWFDSSWKRRVPIFINNTGNAITLMNYQVNLNVPYDSDMNANFSDLRIVNDTSGLEIPFWNETVVNSDHANIWVNFSYLNSSSWINNSYFLYYGNANVSNNSNGTATFELFDDFNSGSTPSTEKWFITGAATVSAGVLDTDGNGIRVNSKKNWTIPIILNYKSRNTRPDATTWSRHGLINGSHTITDNVQQIGVQDDGNQGGNGWYTDFYLSSLSQTLIGDSSTAWHTYEIKWSPGILASINRDGGLYTGVVPDGTVPLNAMFGDYGTDVDWVYVRKYSANVPTAILGAEEIVKYTPSTPIINTVTQGNFWINYTWSAGAGNVSDSYNVSIGGTWYNGTTTRYKNVTLSAHANADAIIYAFNSSGTGTLSTTAATQSYTLANNLPVMISNAITPTTAYTADTLSSSTLSASDADSDSVTYTYQWYENNVSMSGRTSSTLDPQYTTKGSAYKVLVTPNDGYGSGTATYSNEVTILNTAPTAPIMTSNLGLNEINHFPTITFTKGTDADGDTVSTYVYADTTPNPTILETTTTGTSALLGNTTALIDNGTYYIRLQSYDGTTWNNTYSTTATFRMNSPPTVPVLSTPANGINSLIANQTLDWVNSTDAQGDSITYNLSVNGSVISTGLTISQAILETVYGAYNWTVQAYDGHESSAWAALFHFNNNNDSFVFSDKTLSETVIPTSTGSTTISLKIISPVGNITSAQIEITYVGTQYYYPMTNGTNNSWSYIFKTGSPGTYTITGFQATDNLNATNSTTWNQQIVVVPISAGGSSGGDGGSTGTSSGTPTPAPTTVIDLPSADIPNINLRSMGETPGGATILYLTTIGGIGMMILGAASKRFTTSTMVWGVIILIGSLYGLGVIN